MDLDTEKLSPEERYQSIGGPMEEVKLRKYSYQAGKPYISIKRFKIWQDPKRFSPPPNKRGTLMVGAYLALEFF